VTEPPSEAALLSQELVPTPAAARPSLAARAPAGEAARDPEAILAAFLDWVSDLGLELYPAQEEALLELFAGKHVILNTPTGSGKSLVALGLHFKALCEGRTSFYTSPIKALASEKFFALCEDFGPERVGMLTGDASINPRAPVVCCTAEVLSNMALRRGEALAAPYVVMDEFHYYSDLERGVAWQVPLISLPRTQFLLMSATLGDTSAIAEHLRQRSGREVALVASEQRPVPLDFDYRETPLHETVEALLAAGKAPIYIVSFTQRECAELAQALTSMAISSREERERIREAVGDFRLDTPYGKEFRRFLSFGVGVHHAGLLPKYRLLVEQLSQQGLLKVICGTDTLGVGVNIPIRTVLFSRLAKFDGKKTAVLSVRDFKQIAGRAGRKGFDVQGSVVAQAPEHVIEKRMAARKADGGKRRRAPAKAASKGEVTWSEETFEKLITRPPETLRSRFRITHGMALNLLQRDAEQDDPGLRNFTSLRDLIARSHEDEATKARLLSHAAALVRSLYRAGVLRMVRDLQTRYLWVVVNQELQWDFSLHQALSLYLVETLELLDPESPDYALDVITLTESILEDPEIVLRKQADKAKQELLARLKEEGMPYEERMERLEEVTHPQPLADFLYGVFVRFRRAHPWVGGREIRPKSIGREMFAESLSFADYVKRPAAERRGAAALPLAALQDARAGRAAGGEERGGARRHRLLPRPHRAHRHEPPRGVGEPAAPRDPPRPRARAAAGARGAVGRPAPARPARLRGAGAGRDAPAGARARRARVGGGGALGAPGPRGRLGRRALRGSDGALLRRLRRAGLHRRGAPPSLDRGAQDRRPHLGGGADAARSGGRQPVGGARLNRPAAPRRGGRAPGARRAHRAVAPGPRAGRFRYSAGARGDTCGWGYQPPGRSKIRRGEAEGAGGVERP
jgi:superfamily II DNA/RNA helicase